MADGVEFSILGLDSLLGKLGEVSMDVRRKGGRAALRKAAQVVVQKAKAGAERIDDKATGRSISDNIALRWNGRLFKRTGDLAFASECCTAPYSRMAATSAQTPRRPTGA